LEWDYARNQLRILRAERPDETIEYEFESNQMYLAEVEDFFSRVHHREVANHSLREAELTLQVALAALKSAAERKGVSFA
jgi:predicted dehydrogenase